MLQVYDYLESNGGTVTLDADDLTSPPAAPTNLSATITGDNTFNLTWTDGSTTEEGFRLYRGAVDDTPDATLAAGVTAADSVDLGYAGTAGELINLSLVAANRFGESTPVTISFAPLGVGSLDSPSEGAFVGPAAPLTITPFPGATSYDLYLSTDSTLVDSLDNAVRYPGFTSGDTVETYVTPPTNTQTVYYWTVVASSSTTSGSLTVATQSFTVNTDSNLPVVPTISGVPLDPTNTQNGNSATFSGEAGVDFVYSLSGATTLADTTVADSDSNGTETVTLPLLNEGVSTLSVFARDAGGNESSPASYTFTVDVTVATPTGVASGDITGAPTEYTTIPNPTFSWDAGEAGSEYEYSLDGGTTVAGTTLLTSVTVGPIAPGAYSFAVRQIDTATNVSGWSTGIPFTYIEPTTVEITLDNPTVPAVVVAGGGATLDRTAGDIWPLTVTVLDGTITAYDWWLNGTSQATAGTYDLAANDPATVLGMNTLTLFVEINGRWYSTEILFEVVEN